MSSIISIAASTKFFMWILHQNKNEKAFALHNLFVTKTTQHSQKMNSDNLKQKQIVIVKCVTLCTVKGIETVFVHSKTV